MPKRTPADGFDFDELLLLHLFALDGCYKLMPDETGMKLENIKSIMRALRKRFKVNSTIAVYHLALDWQKVTGTPDPVCSLRRFPKWKI